MIPSDNPPSTTNIAPVVHSLRVKYSAASAISSSVPIRPNAWAGASDSSLFLDSTSVISPALWYIWVGTAPGTMQFTRIFEGPNSAAKTLVIASIAPFVAA